MDDLKVKILITHCIAYQYCSYTIFSFYYFDNISIINNDNYFRNINTVSYTHLDVYKRQV